MFYKMTKFFANARRDGAAIGIWHRMGDTKNYHLVKLAMNGIPTKDYKVYGVKPNRLLLNNEGIIVLYERIPLDIVLYDKADKICYCQIKKSDFQVIKNEAWCKLV